MKYIDEDRIKRMNMGDTYLASKLEEGILINGFYGIPCHQNVIVVYRASNGLDIICANFDKYNNHKIGSRFKDIDTANKTLQAYKDMIEARLGDPQKIALEQMQKDIEELKRNKGKGK